MNLKNILQDINIEEVKGDINIEINNLTQDTREDFKKGTLYFAIEGTQVDGHDFIGNAIDKGAVAIICEKLPINIKNNITYIVIKNISLYIGLIASGFYGNPSRELKVITITGTNGKTTIATALYQSLLELDQKPALFSTAGDFINGKEIQTNKKASSSMEIIELHKTIRLARNNKCNYLCIEATSHALDQNRLNGIQIAGAIYTNLSQDHIDYHKTFEHYTISKKKLFDMLKEESFVLANIDDKHAAKIISDTKAKIITYGDKNFDNPISRNLVFETKGFGLSGTKVLLDNKLANIKFVGKFNMYNILSVYGALIELGFDIDKIIKVLANIKGARGRMEIVTGNREGVIGIVDYAHTPDALENVLETLVELPHNKIITVVGVGGDRDREKRPQMAHIAQKSSDYVFFTSDNPRTEDLDQIFNDLLTGCDSSINNFEKIEDRESSIKKAVEISNSGDIILIAGKGHEDYQIIGTTKHHFDDVEVLKKYL